MSDAAVPMEIAPVVPIKVVPEDKLMLPPVVEATCEDAPAVIETSEPPAFALVPTEISMEPASPDEAEPVVTETAPEDT